MLVKTYTAAVNGLEASRITVEVNMTRGVQFHLSGLADTAVRESYDRIRAAVSNIGFKPPTADITINLSPADIRKEGSGYDLPLAVGILAAHGKVSDTCLPEYMMIGELGLDGTLKPVSGALPVAIRARAEKFKGLIVPRENAREAAVVNQLDVYGMDSLADVVGFFNGSDEYEPTIVDTRKEFYEQQYSFDLDFADVRGQESVKRALEVAAAGGHNLIMIGAPGSGKSMMAKRLPSILPPLSLAESLETTQIHSVAGKLPAGTSLISQRPFRSPHHTMSQVAMTGGGSRALPGGVPLLADVRGFDEPLPLRLLRRPDAPLRLHPGPDTAVYEQDQRASSRPYRHPLRGGSGAFQATLSDGARRGERRHPRAGDQGQAYTGKALQGLQRHSLQRPNDGANDTSVCRTRCCILGYASYGHGAVKVICTCL